MNGMEENVCRFKALSHCIAEKTGVEHEISQDEITGLWVKIETEDSLNARCSNCNPQTMMLENCCH
jgi:hypothetical protein